MRLLSILVIALLGSGSARAAENISIARWAKGKIEYRILSTGEVWGSEEWHMTGHPDGSRTMQTRSRMDKSGVQRHVILRVADSFRPLDLTAVYFVKGEWRGTGLFAINANQLRALVNTPDGMIEQIRTVPDHFSIIPHPLATNAWGTWYYDKKKGGKQTQTLYDMDGRAQSVGSMLGKMYDQTLEYLGQEEVTTPAGKFMTDHFRSIESKVDLYITGPDAILVRFVWAAADNEFVLTQLEAGTK